MTILKIPCKNSNYISIRALQTLSPDARDNIEMAQGYYLWICTTSDRRYCKPGNIGCFELRLFGEWKKLDEVK